MRRQQRYIINCALAIALIVILVDVFRQWLELKAKKDRLTWENYDGEQTIKSAVIGGMIGAGLGYAYYRYIIYIESKVPFDPDKYLLIQQQRERIDSNEKFNKKVMACKQYVKKDLVELFKNNLVCEPEDIGSFYKKTANVSNYDFDIVLPIRREAFHSLNIMYNHVFTKLRQNFDKSIIITKRKKTISLEFQVEGRSIKFDIVPGREIGDYLTDRYLNLYVRPSYMWQNDGSFKINTFQQRNITENRREVKIIIRLLKIYRDKNKLQLPSVLIEQCVVKALSTVVQQVSFGKITDDFLHCMGYIAIKLSHSAIIDLANTNNNLNNKISLVHRQFITSKLQGDINAVKNNTRCLKEIFEQ